ncbi:putative ribonuclease H [Salmonella phage SPAsTU]|nr:putative ribonuclease H [Salmonella phage STsAS]AWN09140.1 putative ribonuclease H [Salmonella phage SPAsTU]
MKDVDVAVIYTDGSHTEAPKGSGAGIHGYLFNTNDLEESQAYQHPEIPERITTVGYKQLPKDVKCPDVPAEVQFVDAVIPVPKEFYSDVGELVAFLTLFEDAPFTAKNYIIYVDATYVLNTYTSWIDGWAKNGWRRADGTPIANLELIQRMWEVKQRMKKEGRGVRVIKIKGHSGRYGNDRVDELARKGSAISATNDGIMYKAYWSQDELPETAEPEIIGEGSDLAAYPAVCTVKYCYPMVNETPPQVEADGKNYYCMFGGNHAKNKDDLVFIGKMIPDAHFSVMFTEKPWDNIYTIVNSHSIEAWKDTPRMRRYDPIAVVNNEFVKRKKFAEQAKNGLPVQMMHFSEDRNVWFFEDLAISRMLRPPLLSYRALQIREELGHWLKDTLNKEKRLVLNDITDLLFDDKGKPVKDYYRNVDRAINLRIDFPMSKKPIPVILTRGIDIPSRTEINRIKEPEGRFYIVAERPEKYYIRYALVYIGKEYHGLWCAYYANRRILREEEV